MKFLFYLSICLFALVLLILAIPALPLYVWLKANGGDMEELKDLLTFKTWRDLRKHREV